LWAHLDDQPALHHTGAVYPRCAQVAAGMPALRKGAVMRMLTSDMAEQPGGRSHSMAGANMHSKKHIPHERITEAENAC